MIISLSGESSYTIIRLRSIINDVIWDMRGNDNSVDSKFLVELKREYERLMFLISVNGVKLDEEEKKE